MRRDDLATRAAVLGATTALLWLVRVIDTFRSTSIAGHGIVPRTVYGLEGIPTAPLIHADWEHLLANSIPFVILGALVLLRGISTFLFVTFASALAAGAGTWLFGSGHSEHIGASGVVFGFFGYLVVRAVFDRRIASIVLMLVVVVLYGASMLSSLVPAAGVSWTAHVFGFLGGVLAARTPGATRLAAA